MTLPDNTTLTKWAAVAAGAVIVGLFAARHTLREIQIQSNEEQAIADMIEFGTAQIRFAGYIGGAYGTTAMLSDPNTAPNTEGKTVGHPRFVWPVRNGYRFVLRPLPMDVNIPTPWPGTFRAYQYIAFPVMTNAPGARSFMYESSTSMIHYRTDGQEPEATDPRALPQP